MKVKTTNLFDTPLDWAVAKCLGVTPIAVRKNYSEGWLLYSHPNATIPLEYSSKWSQGGPIIEREKISVELKPHGYWMASFQNNYADEKEFLSLGPTPLTAAMRCFVASLLGDEVDIPEELLK